MDVEITEVIGEKSEGDVLQALAGEGNLYAMVIIEFREGEGGPEMNIRLPSNAPGTETLKGILRRALEALQ